VPSVRPGPAAVPPSPTDDPPPSLPTALASNSD
jgi:hypothetical protein